MTSNTRDSQRQQLLEIQEILKGNRDLYKPMFGLMFWELAEAAKHLKFEEISKESLSLTMTGEEDEALGALVSIYLQIWDSANDFNAASRFMASTLELSADELIQSKIIFEQRTTQ